MDKKTTVSVVIPCFNARRYIRESVESVLSQTVLPKEVLVIDDGSTDGSGDIANSINDRVRVIRQLNKGESAARNCGMNEASGDWIAFLDADDIWDPQKLELQLSAIRKEPDTVCVHTNYYIFGKEGKLIPSCKPEALLAGDYRIETMLLECLIHTSTAMVRQDIPLRFAEWAHTAEDMLFFTELSSHGRFLYVDEPLVGYRRHSQQQTQCVDSWTHGFTCRFRWVDENERILGSQKAEDLRRLLRQQAIERLRLAIWNRQWARYDSFKKYAESLEWPEGRPSVLKERLYPRFAYTAKDIFDKIFR